MKDKLFVVILSVCDYVAATNVKNELMNYMFFFYISNTFTSNARLKLPKKKYQVNAKQHPEAELLLFENYSHSSFTLSFKNNRTYSKNYPNEKVRLCS